MPLRSAQVSAYAAAVLAFGSAAVSLYWMLGGTGLLDTVGGTFEDLSRERSPQSIVLGMLVVLVKVTGGLLALAWSSRWAPTSDAGCSWYRPPWEAPFSSSTEECSSSLVGSCSPT